MKPNALEMLNFVPHFLNRYKTEELEWQIARIIKQQNPTRNRVVRQRPVIFPLLKEAQFRHPKPKLKAQSRIFLTSTKQVTISLHPIRQQTLMQEESSQRNLKVPEPK